MQRCPINVSGAVREDVKPRLISVEDVRNYLSHIIYILIFDFFLNFLLLVRLQTPTSSRLISVEDVRNYLSHIIYILIFDFFLNFLLLLRLQTPTSSRCWKEV